MKIVAIIEKGSDGRYGVRSESKVGNSYFGGFGEREDCQGRFYGKRDGGF